MKIYKQINTMSLFLLYVSVMLIITFLQQEFVLLPELQNLDIVGEGARAEFLEKWSMWRWVAFMLSPVLLLIRLSLISLCFFIGSFFFSDIGGKKFKDWWGVAMKAQVVMVLYSVVLCSVNVISGANEVMEVTKYSSLLFLGSDVTEQWIKMPLAAVNIFEVAYWFVMAHLVRKETGSRYGESFKFVMSSYGVGYLFYIVLLMFLILYLG